MIHDFDSFDSYRTENISQKWTDSTPYNPASQDGCSIVLGQGRCNSNCGRTQSHPGSHGFTKGIPMTGPTFQFGAAFNIQRFSAGSTNAVLLYKAEIPVAAIAFDSSGSFTWVYNPDSAFPPIAWVSNGGLYRAREWYQFSMGGTLAPDGSGTVTIKIGGITVQTITGRNTWNAYESEFNAIMLGAGGFTGIILWDDYFVGDLTGPYNNTQLGDVHVQKMNLQADGAIIGWTPVGAGAGNWDKVEDEDLPDLTNGIESAVAGTTDIYEVEDLANVGGQEVFAVKMSELTTKDSPGDRALDIVVYDGAPHAAGKYKPIQQQNYVYIEHVLEADPCTSAQWTPAGFNARQIGPKLAV